MIKAFENLAEFEALRDDEKLDRKAVEAWLDLLCFKKLIGILSNFNGLRAIRIRQWAKELRKITGQPIRLRVTQEEIAPYMQEDGLICFCKQDFYRRDKVFMIFAHETAHFILMQDTNYGRLKKLDKEYKAMPNREQAMHSPIEKCANLITLMILQRCMYLAELRKTRKKVAICLKSLNQQLTRS